MRKTFFLYYLVYVSFIIVFAFGLNIDSDSKALIDRLKTIISQYGILSPIVYILIVCLAILIPPIPDSPFILAGGISLAFPVAVISASIAFAISATVNFYIGRYFSEKLLRLITTENDRAQINSFSKYINTRSVFIFRLLPGISFGLISYASGFSKLVYKKYLVATMVPTVIYTLIVFYFIDQLIFSPNIFLIVSLISVGILLIFPLLMQIKSFDRWIKMSK